MPKQELAGPEIAGLAVKDRYFRAPQAVSAVFGRLQTDESNPAFDETDILACRKVSALNQSAGEQPAVRLVSVLENSLGWHFDDQDINGTASNDSITGTVGDDTIHGLDGSDIINGPTQGHKPLKGKTMSATERNEGNAELETRQTIALESIATSLTVVQEQLLIIRKVIAKANKGNTEVAEAE